jgi:hypothetical protein
MARKPRAATAAEKPKADSTADVAVPALIGKADIKRSALEAWRKLDAAIQTELDAIQNGGKELNASTATAIIKYVESSISLASGSEDLSAKDAQDRQRAIMANLTLPTFDD